MHALQLMRQFIQMGHEVITWGDETVPGTSFLPRDETGLRALDDAADIHYVRFDGNRVGDDPLLVQFLRVTQKPVVWEINSPANEALAFSYLGGNRRQSKGLMRLADAARRRIHAQRQMPAIRQEEVLRKELASRAFAAMCVSASIEKYAREGLGFTRAEVVPNGADPAEQRPDGPVAAIEGVDPDRLKIIYAGSPIYPWQGLDMLRETMLLCQENDDPIHFVLLLNQPSPQALPTRNATIRTKIAHEDVPSYLRAVDAGIFIYPDFSWSRWGSHGSPMKMFEYMACGLPVFGSNIGQIAEVIDHGRNGMLFENTPEDLRKCLLDAATQKPAMKKMGLNARHDVVSRYNWRNVAESTLAVFKAAISHSPLVV